MATRRGGAGYTVAMNTFDQQALRGVMGQFCTGVVIATGAPEGVPAGFAAQSFVSLSLDPPLVALCPGKTSTSWPKLREAGAFCINVLAAEQGDVCAAFARPGGGAGEDKFAGVDWRPGQTGAPVLGGTLAYIECTLEQEIEAGDHYVAIGRVQAIEQVSDAGPLLFFRGGYGEFSAAG
ncbi:MAG: flavin reductase family protein [Pseudomonadota bacterium]